MGPRMVRDNQYQRRGLMPASDGIPSSAGLQSGEFCATRKSDSSSGSSTSGSASAIGCTVGTRSASLRWRYASACFATRRLSSALNTPAATAAARVALRMAFMPATVAVVAQLRRRAGPLRNMSEFPQRVRRPQLLTFPTNTVSRYFCAPSDSDWASQNTARLRCSWDRDRSSATLTSARVARSSGSWESAKMACSRT